MLYRMERLIGMSVQAVDGAIGKVEDVYFDDHRWAARYLVVDTGSWLAGRKVLVSPIALDKIDWLNSDMRVTLTRQQVRDSPPVDSDKPISRQHEADLLGYYGYPSYWGGPFMWGTTSYPYPLNRTVSASPDVVGPPAQATGDPHLRSVKEVTGYHLQTTNASMGHVEGFLADDESWALRYIVVDTRNWWPGRHVVISPQWITRVEWAERTVTVDVARDMVQCSPEYDPGVEYSRAHEASLFRHYQRPGYWQ